MRLICLMLIALVHFGSSCAWAAPTDDEFRNALNTCAAGAKTKFSANLIGSINDIYENNKEKVDGQAEIEVQSYILQALPEAQRLEGYRLYIECVRQILNPPNKDSGIGLDKANDFIADIGDLTPLSRLNSFFGEPYREEINALRVSGKKLDFRMYEFEFLENKQFVFAFTDPKLRNRIFAVGVMEWPNRDEKFYSQERQSLKIPFMNMAECTQFSAAGDECIQEKQLMHLGEFSLSNLSPIGDTCNVDKPIKDLKVDARYLYFFVSNCYFGRPGSYKNFSFAFDISSPVVSDSEEQKCFAKDQEGKKNFFDSSASLASDDCKGFRAIKPFLAMAVVQDDAIDGELLANYVCQLMFWQT